MSGRVRVKGLRELDKALRRCDKELQKGVRREIREAAKVVSDEARSRLGRYDERSARGIRPRTRSGFRASIEQTRKRTTGQHPEWGTLVMRRAMLPALAAKQDEVVERLEKILDRLGGIWDD